MNPALSAWICIFSPLVGAALTPLLAKINLKLRDFGAVLFSFIAAGAALSLLPLAFHPESLPIESSVIWLASPIEIDFGVLLDPLSIIVVNVVAVISFIIMVYCVGYMKGDPGQTRFWMWMNAFIGSMVLLVLSGNLLFLFVGWKLVGVCSYGLIGFYYKDEQKYWIGGPAPNKFVTPSEACIKALVVTGVGDMLMLAGILIMFYYSGTLNILQLYETSSVWIPQIAETPGMMLLVSILLLAGPVGKSAQFPFHEWLPEAMAGPGPVSALIHAATMVKSGVYLVARLTPIFYFGQWVAGSEEASIFFVLVAWIGAITAFLAATQGIVAKELKKVLAYSTVSQIGYMMLGLGIAGMSPSLLLGGYTSGVFHLVSHALFKACLFLCAGTVIHSVHSIYITDMGTLRKYLPLTWIFMLIASLSLIGMPPLPGFWSKDAILLYTLEGNKPLFALALITVGLTSFYTIRCFGMVFHGKASKNVVHAKESGGHMNDGYPSMWIACGILAVAIVGMGIIGPKVEHMLHHGFEYNLVSQLSLPVAEAAEHGALVPILSIAFLVIGAGLAILMYIARKISVEKLLQTDTIFEDLRIFFWRRWYIDGFYLKVFVDGTLKLSSFVANSIEDNFDHWVHSKFPTFFTHTAYEGLKNLGTEKRQLLYNISYILAFFVLFIVVFFKMLGD
ncbi:MAG: NADH-quinone oxidoreductase subunit L [Proteobacteria bacterium]|nr:NADH-quinone oxidoreductase subunit L [Pseudomonadota bacterium]